MMPNTADIAAQAGGLLPCPFCGGAADHTIPHIIECSECFGGFYEKDAKKLIAAWNRRTPLLAAIEPQAVAEPAGDAETVVGMAAGILCETGTLCGWPAPNCNAYEGAEALFKAGLLAVAPPASNSSGDGADEQEIDRLRLQAFKTNSAEDRSAYFNAVSKWFQDRHYRRMAQPVTASDERAVEAEGTDIREIIHRVLCDHRMDNWVDADDPQSAYPLVDLVTPKGCGIDVGEQELFSLADEIAYTLAVAPKAQPVQGWQTMDSAKAENGTVLTGWGEYRERDGFSPAFMRWYDSVGGWSVNAMPFYPTHWMPLLAGPSSGGI